MKTIIQLKEMGCNDFSDCKTAQDYSDKQNHFMNQKWYSQEELLELLNIKIMSEQEEATTKWSSESERLKASIRLELLEELKKELNE